MSDDSVPARLAVARVLIVDDNPFVRVGLRATLRGAEDLEVVGEAANGQEAVHLCYELRPDLVITDLRMPIMDGLEATAAIKATFPEILVLVLTVADSATYDEEAERAGADAILPKDTSRAQLLRRIRRLLSHKP
jgi:DNA-binding NarL/FixJ family response regulator